MERENDGEHMKSVLAFTSFESSNKDEAEETRRSLQL